MMDRTAEKSPAAWALIRAERSSSSVGNAASSDMEKSIGLLSGTESEYSNDLVVNVGGRACPRSGLVSRLHGQVDTQLTVYSRGYTRWSIHTWRGTLGGMRCLMG